MTNPNILRESDRIFSTGAHLQPTKVIINGREQWRWVLVGQEDPAYYVDGQEIRVHDYADTLQNLLCSDDHTDSSK